MSKILVLFYDDKCGIQRVPISDGSFPLGKVGDRLVIAYILDTLNDILSSLDIFADIIIPFPHGVDDLNPHLSPKDLFYHTTSGAWCEWSSVNADNEQQMFRQLKAAADAGNAKLYATDDPMHLKEHLGQLVTDQTHVWIVSSGQIFLNTALSLELYRQFNANGHTCVEAVGHDVGLTPQMFTRSAFMKFIQTSSPEHVPVAQQIALDPVLEELGKRNISLNYRSSRSTVIAKMVMETGTPGNQTLGCLLDHFRRLIMQKTYTSSKGKTVPVFWGDSERYWPTPEEYPAKPQFSEFFSAAVRDVVLLQKKTGLDLSQCRILELGCGDGTAAMVYKAMGVKKVVGTDADLEKAAPSLRRLLAIWPSDIPKNFQVNETEWGYSYSAGLEFRTMPAEFLAFEDNVFDIVVSNQMLEHVQNPHRAMNESLRVTKPGGYVIVRYNPWFHLTGGHGACTTDIPWGHLLLDDDEMEEYYLKTEFPERAADARIRLTTYFNPKRLYLKDFEEILHSLLPLHIVHYETSHQPFRSELITHDLLQMARGRYPEVTYRDMVTNQVLLIVQKTVCRHETRR
jgi:SAM-dependent methyltransferase